ncbi:uncharacterized protein LOC120255703 [Dioscorea cayenensis subsp. rotundata]|uniref:Uncharacterized protein LOC120255703 n=1 Tax=Dioscorea cayennensis subsp. rotundata TaxID=55577 RepID=A0AB40AW95_DIOCR|nr:uncharacterized protein LOC120255703 [Dioscorea cayenensis subsp. rotundata]
MLDACYLICISEILDSIFLSALKYHVFPDNFYHPRVINSFYSFLWDATDDRDLSDLSRIFKFKTHHFLTILLYERQWVYYWVIGSNLISRSMHMDIQTFGHLRHNYLNIIHNLGIGYLCGDFSGFFFRG